MCGIAGFITDGAPPDRSVLKRMCDQIAHRGPDGFGTYFNGPVALGHRRLSIIDLEGGTQPLGNEDGSIQVVFNGEIYNYLELRADLIERGHVFKTASDTEVLVHLYEDVGEHLPLYLNGMFAFAIWDSRKQILFAARDRFGEKPFYFMTGTGEFRFAFASELKALAGLPGFRQPLNRRAISDFLCLSYIPDPDTIYAGVSKLQAAHSLVLSSAGVRVSRYWRPNFSVNRELQLEETVERVRELSADSVRRRMISDVPLGAFLSGGVDSSAVVAFMAAFEPRNVKTFSIGFTNKEFDELNFARIMAVRYRTDHHERVVTPSIHQVLAKLVKHYDEPFADSSAIPTLYLSQMTRENVSVALSGDGADELFGGYRRYRFSVFEDRIRHVLPGWFRRTVVRFGAEHFPQLDYVPRPLRAKATLTELSQELGDSYFSAMTVFRDGALSRILSPDLKHDLNGYCSRQSFRDRFHAVRELPPLKQLQAIDLETYLPGDILVKVDRASMAHSLETRAPWLDPRIAELACQVPTSFCLRRGIGKYIFKQAVRDIVSEPIITRSKMGFGVPIGEWFRVSLKETFESIVFTEQMSSLISLQEARNIWNAHQARQRNFGSHLWHLLILGCWVNQHYNTDSQHVLTEIASQ